MTSEVDICNLALGRIKKGTIASLDEDSAEAEECNRLYAIARDHVLCDFPWSVNTSLVSLTPLVNDREDDWDYKYQRPPTCKRLREIMPETGRKRTRKRVPSEMNAAGIYTNVENARAIIQTLVTDTTLYTPALVSLIAWRLGYELCGPLDGEMNLMAWADRKYEREKSAAWATDASEHVNNDDDAEQCAGSGELPSMILCRE